MALEYILNGLKFRNGKPSTRLSKNTSDEIKSLKNEIHILEEENAKYKDLNKKLKLELEESHRDKTQLYNDLKKEQNENISLQKSKARTTKAENTTTAKKKVSGKTTKPKS